MSAGKFAVEYALMALMVMGLTIGCGVAAAKAIDGKLPSHCAEKIEKLEGIHKAVETLFPSCTSKPK